MANHDLVLSPSLKTLNGTIMLNLTQNNENPIKN